MTTILTDRSMERPESLGRDYFLPYQLDWIRCADRKVLAEKAVRVGWTFADAFKQTRKRLLSPRQDYLFVTKDQPTAFEYIEHCWNFLEIFNHTSSVLVHGEDEITVPVYDEQGRDTGFAEQVKVGLIKLDNGARLIAFSSNPNAVRAYGGDVGWDEAAFHPRARQMWAALQGRARWGFDMGVWSSHNGDDTFFLQLAEQARGGENGWTYFRTDIHEAVEAGLVEKINEVRGTNFSREEYLEDCKRDAVIPEIYEQEYELRPLGGLDPIVAWERIAACRSAHCEVERAHVPDAQVEKLFGPPLSEGRRRRVADWMRQAFSALYERRGTGGRRWRVGFDVAASGGQGHLAAVTVTRMHGGRHWVEAILTFQTEDWDVIEWCVSDLFSGLPGEVRGAGDETGLGRQICWRLQQLHSGRFIPVNFSSAKKDLGTELMALLTSGEVRLPAADDELAHDCHALRKTFVNGRMVFLESRNPANEHSHCDLAWSLALALHADIHGGAEVWVLDQSVA